MHFGTSHPIQGTSHPNAGTAGLRIVNPDTRLVAATTPGNTDPRLRAGVPGRSTVLLLQVFKGPTPLRVAAALDTVLYAKLQPPHCASASASSERWPMQQCGT